MLVASAYAFVARLFAVDMASVDNRQAITDHIEPTDCDELYG